MSTDLLAAKADLALSDISANGGLLSPVQNSTFIRSLMDAPTVLGQIRVVPMTTPQQKINKIGFGSRILRVAPQGTAPFLNDSNVNSRWLPSASRVAPTTSQLTLTTKEIMAEIQLPYEVLEDNIEGPSMVDTILTMIAERAALDLEELLLLGDTGSGDTYLALMNGILKLSTSNVVDAQNTPITAQVFHNLKKALPTRFRRNLKAMRFYSSMDRESDYRLAVASRGSPLGDQMLVSADAIPVLGVPLNGAALMPNTNIFFTDPQNILFGIQRNIRIEQYRDIRARQIIIVLTMRIAIGIEEELAVAKVINLG